MRNEHLIYQGDNGTILQFTVKDENGVVDITGASVSVFVRNKTKTFTKTAAIRDEQNGVCEIVLNSDDIVDAGSYNFQATVTFPNQKSFSSNPDYFRVYEKLA